MRILYGVTGEGLGHTMRARVVGHHLAARGHQVLFAASGRALAVLSREFDVLPIAGFELVYGRGHLRRAASLAHNVARAPTSLKRNLGAALEEAKRYDPQVVLTDFDSFAHGVGKLLGRPIVSVDHHHVIDRFVHPTRVRKRLGASWSATRAVVRAKTPGCDHYLVSSFFAPVPRPRLAPRTTLVGPILRPEIERATPRAAEHFVVYQTSATDPALLAALSKVPARFVLYGRGERDARPAPNVDARAFDEAQFVEDLATSRGLVSHGGHTALAEAVVLGKPVLCFPLRNHGEQELNAAYLAEMGLGLAGGRPSARAIVEFVSWVESAPPSTRRTTGNASAGAALDAILRRFS